MRRTSLFNTGLVALFTAFAASAVTAAPMGDADPGYPGLVHGQVVTATQAGPLLPRVVAVRVTSSLVQGEAFNFPEPQGLAKTRAQVRAETLEAIRVGAISRGERHEFPSAQQLDSIRTAGLRALGPAVAGTGVAATVN